MVIIRSKITLVSTITFLCSGLTLVAAFGSLMLVDKFSPVPFNLFYLGTLLFCLACALEFRNIVKFLRRKYYWISSRQILRFAVTTLIAILLMVMSFDRKNLHDWTAQQFYSISDQNIDFLQKYKFELTIIASRTEHREFFETLERFTDSLQSRLPSLKIQWIDPIQQPSMIDKLKIRTLPCMIVHEQNIETDRIILGKSRLMPKDFRQENRSRFLGEPALIQALVQLKNPKKLQIVFLGQKTAFGSTPETALLDESPPGYAALKDILDQDGFEVSSAETIKKSSDPMIVFLPLNPLSEINLNALSKRLVEGLPTLLLHESQPINPLTELGQKYGIEFLRYPLIDHIRKYKNDLTLIAPYYEDHALTAGLSNRSEPVILQGASAFRSTTGSKLLISSRVSWLETNLSKLEDPRFDNSEDINGPLAIMIEHPHKILWMADQDFLNNRYLGLPGNRSFALHIAHYLSGQIDLINQRGKTLEGRYLGSVQQLNRQFIVIIFLVMPSLCFVLAASLMWLKTRY